jgi:hypothetical protein
MRPAFDYWVPRRVPSRSHSTEPPQARQADPGAGADRGDAALTAVVAPPIRTAAITSNEDFFNGIAPNRTLLCIIAVRT